MTAPPERTALYRYFDASGVLLYVGISIDPDGRLKAHRDNHEPWVGEAAKRTDEWHDSRPLALKAEADAITAERPRCNVKHNYDDAPFDPASWPEIADFHKVPGIAELMRTEITSGRWAPGQRIPSLRALGEAAGASIRIVSKASTQLQSEGLLNFQPGHGVFVAHSQEPRPKLPHNFFWELSFPG